MSTPVNVFEKEAILVLPAYMEGSRVGHQGEKPGDNFKRALEHYQTGMDRDFGGLGEVIVFDDGSTDDTAKIAVDAGITVLTHDDEQNHGRGRALSTAFTLLDGRTRMVGYTDADGSYDWSAQRQLIELVENGADFANAYRLVGGDQHAGLARRVGHSVLNGICSVFAPTGVRDPQAGAKWMNGRVAAELWADVPDRWAADRQALHRAYSRGLNIAEAGFAIDSAEESTVRPLKDGLEMIRDSILIYNMDQRQLNHSLRAGAAHQTVNGLGKLVHLAAAR